MRFVRFWLLVTIICMTGLLALSANEEGFLLTKRQGACWSPDGTKIAFTNIPDLGKGPEEPWIWVVDLDQQSCRALVRGEMPDWSPDGNTIVFARDRRLYTKDTRTGEERELLKEGESGGYPAWSPAGDKIAYSAYTTPPGICILDLATMQRQMVMVTRTPGGKARWSPDGKKLVNAVVEGDQDGTTYFNVKVSAPGRLPKRIAVTEDKQWNLDPDWSPAGGTIIYTSNKGRSFHGLWAASFDEAQMNGMLELLDHIGCYPPRDKGTAYIDVTNENLAAMSEVATVMPSLFRPSLLVYDAQFSWVPGTRRGDYSGARFSRDGKSLVATYWDGVTDAEGICIVSQDGLSVRQVVDSAQKVAYAIDTTLPVLTVDAPNKWAGQVGITAQASDDRKLDKVVYILDGTVVAVLTKAPFVYAMDADKLLAAAGPYEVDKFVDTEEGERSGSRVALPPWSSSHELVVQAFDAAGNMVARRLPIVADAAN